MVDCTFASITAPAVLPNTAGLDFFDLVKPNTIYEILDQFVSQTSECALINLQIEPVTLGTVANYTSTDGVSEAQLLKVITNASIQVQIPDIQEIARNFTFRLKASTASVSIYSADIKVQLTNCDYMPPDVNSTVAASISF